MGTDTGNSGYSDGDVELCLDYQAELAGLRSAAHPDGAAAAVLDRFGPIVGGIVKDHRRRRAPGEAEDLIGELQIALLEAARDFDPAREVPFRPWLRQRLKRRYLEFLAGQNPAAMFKSRDKIVRYYYGAQAALRQELQREPTAEELYAEVESGIRHWARGRLRAAGKLTDGQTQADVDALIDRKLRKQGMYAALRELFPSVAARHSIQSLDQTFGDDDATLLDVLADNTGGGDPAAEFEGVNPIWGMFTDAERASLLLREGIVDGQQQSYRQVGEQLGIAWTDVRRLVTQAKAKVSAPHAHYAYLSGVVRRQFEQAPTTPVGRLRTRAGAQ